MKRTALLSSLTMLVTAPASAATWDFYVTSCISGFPANACTGLPGNPYLFGAFTADSGPGGSTLSAGVKTGDTDFSFNFGPLFVIVNGVQIPAELLDKATDWSIAWGPDDKPLVLSFVAEDSTLRLRGDTIETASDSPDLVGCRTLADCVFTGFWRAAPTAVPEPGTAGLMLTALIGWLGFRWRRALTTARSALTR